MKPRHAILLAAALVAAPAAGQFAPTLGPRVVVQETPNFLSSPPEVAFSPAGSYLAVWSDLDANRHFQIYGRLFDAAGGLSGAVFQITPAGIFPGAPRVAANGAGFAVAWTEGGIFLRRYDAHGTPLNDPVQLDPPIVGQRLDPIPCIVGSPVLCMGPNQRFQARVAWTNPGNGDTGIGRSLPLTSDTGAFWFFGDQNLELMVKVLDGTAVNLRYWLYGGSLSNLDYTLTVTDTLTGVVRTYHNPAGQFSSLADVTAFPFGLSAQRTEKTAAGAAPLRSVACGDFAGLCLSSGQFLVDVSFTDPRTSLAGTARAVPLTGDTGAFWFFDDSNLELMIKVLDGRAVNGKFWVFYGALSDVDYTITVTRLATGEVRTYHNPRGTLASHADIQAF